MRWRPRPCASSTAAACSPRCASASARTPRQAIAALRSSPASARSRARALPPRRRGPARAARAPSSAAACAASMPRPRSRKSLVGAAQAALGGGGVALEQLDATGEGIGLEQAMRDAQLLDHLARRGDHAPRRVGAAAQRFEHPLARERDGFDRRRALRDAQHAHDIEAAAAGARHRARTPERRERRAASTALARRRSPALRAAASARSSAASQAPTLPSRASACACTEVRLGLAGGIADAPRAAAPPPATDVGGGLQALRRGQDRELAG